KVITGKKQIGAGEMAHGKFMTVLETLDHQKATGQENGNEKIPHQGFSVAYFASVDSQHHGKAAGDQDQGVDTAHDPAELLSGLGDFGMGVAQHDIHAEESREKHDLGRQEEPHPERDVLQPFS